MKKLLIAATAFLGLLSMDADAQETKFGAKVGVNLANVTGDDAPDGAEMLIGYQLGGFAHLGLSDAFAIQPELLLDLKGASFTFLDETISTNLTYITIPVLAKYMITEELNVHAGPQIGLLMSAKSDGDDVSEGFSSTDFGLAAGAGYTLETGVSIFARFSTSLSTISDNSDADLKNTVISIGAGYSF